MRAVPEWRSVLRHAWSVRFAVLAAVLGGASAVLSIDPFILPLPLGWAAIVAGLTSAAAGLAGVAATISRVVHQRGVGDLRARPPGDSP